MTRIGALRPALLLLFLCALAARSWVAAEDSDSESEFELTVTGSGGGGGDDSVFQFYAPAGASCERDAASGQEPAAAEATIPVRIAFNSRLLQIPDISARVFHLNLVYASEKTRQLHEAQAPFSLGDATVTPAQDCQGCRDAELEMGVRLHLPCGAYVARVFMQDAAAGASLAFSQDFIIVVNSSSYTTNFCYLVQAPSAFNTDHLTRGNASFAMVLQWKTAPHPPSPHTLFLPNSTWNQGRNALAAAARARNCRYYIFVDEDAQLVHRHWDADGAGVSIPRSTGDTWREFEGLLLEYRPAVAVPHVQWHATNNSHAAAAETIAIFDHIVLAVSASALDCMLPCVTQPPPNHSPFPNPFSVLNARAVVRYETQWDLDSLDYSVVPSCVPRAFPHCIFVTICAPMPSLTVLL